LWKEVLGKDPTSQLTWRWVIWENLGGNHFVEHIILDGKLGRHELQVGDVDNDRISTFVQKPGVYVPGMTTAGKCTPIFSKTCCMRQGPGR
jgi:hypothetical protein